MGLIMRGITAYRSRRAAARGETFVAAPVAGALEDDPIGGEPGEITS
jgi:hypothetical protein